MTGETETLHKSHVTPENYSHNPVPFLLQSSLVDGGEGRAIVCSVGENTQAGQADRALDIQNEMTPLQLKLETIANQIGMLGFYVAILTFIALCVR